MPKQIQIPTLNDSVYSFNEAAINQVRIKLNNDFGEKLLNEYDSSLYYKNDTLFRAVLNGFKIKAEATGNALLRINLEDTNTKLAIYYRFKDTSGDFDTAVRYFRINSFNSANSNYIERDRNQAEVSNYFPLNANAEDSLLYLQTTPGLYSTLKVPGLSGLPNVIVHRAELLMEQISDESADSKDNIFTPPSLFLAAFHPDTMRYFTVPYDVQFLSGTVSNLFSFGVFPIAKTSITGKTIYKYNFDITRYVQGIVTRGEPVYDMKLYAPFNGFIAPSPTALFSYPISSPSINYVGIGRIRIGGGKHATGKMRVHIIYSLI